MDMTKLVPKFVMKYFHEEDYGDYVGYFVIASDQKFLVERVEDEDVTELAIPVRNLVRAAREDLRGLRGALLDCRPLPGHGYVPEGGVDASLRGPMIIGHFSGEEYLWVISPATGVLPI